MNKMIETYMGYNVNPYLFLIPIREIRHIMPSACGDGWSTYSDKKIRTLDLRRLTRPDALSGCAGQNEEIHTLILEKDGDLFGVSGGYAFGVMEVSDDSWKTIPSKLVKDLGRCLSAGVFLQTQGQWAYRIDIKILFEAEGMGRDEQDS